MHVTSTINDSLFALTTSTEYDIHNRFDHFYKPRYKEHRLYIGSVGLSFITWVSHLHVV